MKKVEDWEEYQNTFRKEVKATEWAFDTIKEAFEQVAQDEARKMSIVQEIMIRSADFPRRIIAPVGGQGWVTMTFLCPHCNCIWWVAGRKGRNNWECAVCGEKYDWKQPNRLLVVPTGESVNQAKVFKAHAVPQGLCANLINALKLLANQQERWRRPHTEHRDEPRCEEQEGPHGGIERIHTH